jgi:hypothetical protein
VKRILAALVILGTLGVLVEVFAGPFIFFSTRSLEPELRDGKMVGTIEGTIKRTDPDTSTVRMPSGFLGLLSRPVLVTGQTKIVVGDKLGGFGDLGAGQVVRITYEVFRNRLIARRIELRDRASGPTSFSESRGDEDADETSSVGAVAAPVSAPSVPAPSVPKPPRVVTAPPALVPIRPSPRPAAPAERVAPATPPASLSGARQYGASSPPKRVVPPPAAARPRVAKPRRPAGASKAPAAAKPASPRKELPRPQ